MDKSYFVNNIITNFNNKFINLCIFILKMQHFNNQSSINKYLHNIYQMKFK